MEENPEFFLWLWHSWDNALNFSCIKLINNNINYVLGKFLEHFFLFPEVPEKLSLIFNYYLIPNKFQKKTKLFFFNFGLPFFFFFFTQIFYVFFCFTCCRYHDAFTKFNTNGKLWKCYDFFFLLSLTWIFILLTESSFNVYFSRL